ncbi:MICOS complex subunit MIC26-like [Neoarius graeffei]|uniref:MICOS complex subunit MIC26-like n=1 Tax=Neoarius graeffei TaxID=443677 RepID=UPI00298C11A4|nr:MICOS complex subunit MIC26-like [Neoarius graeffei]
MGLAIYSTTVKQSSRRAERNREEKEWKKERVVVRDRTTLLEVLWIKSLQDVQLQENKPLTVRCISYALEKAEEYYKSIDPGINTSVQTVRDIYSFLINPLSKFYPSVGTVGFSAILRIYLAKGSRVKRLLFPTVSRTLSTSMFYSPHNASLAKAKAKDQISSLGSQTRVLLEDVRKGESPGKKRNLLLEKLAS